MFPFARHLPGGSFARVKRIKNQTCGGVSEQQLYTCSADEGTLPGEVMKIISISFSQYVYL